MDPSLPEGADAAAAPADEALAAMEDTGPGLAGDIALCLSGGGYRAAAFHLGVLDLLDRVGLLPKVRTLSTISGGTIVGAAWALSCARKEPFAVFFARAWKTLRSLNVVSEAVAGLGGRGRREGVSLIRAAAGVYAGSDLFGEAKLGELMASQEGPEDLIFSATEFHSGLAYRFQTSRRSQVVVGNRPPLRIPAEVASQIRLADVVAASSCFPAAFEPLMFPRDFAWDDAEAVRGALGPKFPPAVPLMDGGIYDNQGVDGAVTVYKRSEMSPQLGLLLVSDTSQRREPLFEEVPASRLPRLRLRTLKWISRVGFWLALLSFVTLLYALLTTPWTLAGAPRLILTALVPAGLAGATAWGLWVGRRLLRQQTDAARSTTRVELGSLLGKLQLADVADLATRRYGSLMAMVSEVSMKRVRRLIQDSVLAQTSVFRLRTELMLLYGMDRKRAALWRRYPDLEPSPDLKLLARRAELVPTTLWLDDEEQLRDLVACGQATACVKLLEHLRERRSAALKTPGSPEAAAEEALVPLWAALKQNPFALIARPR
jgi:predicted acylesterase/phospholipase RssA